MKKSIALLSALCLVFCSACSDDKQEKSSSKAETTTEAVTTEAQTEATTEAENNVLLQGMLDATMVKAMKKSFEEQGFICDVTYTEDNQTYNVNLSINGIADKMATKTQEEIETMKTALEPGFVEVYKTVFTGNSTDHLLINLVSDKNANDIYCSYLDGKLQ